MNLFRKEGLKVLLKNPLSLRKCVFYVLSLSVKSEQKPTLFLFLFFFAPETLNLQKDFFKKEAWKGLEGSN